MDTFYGQMNNDCKCEREEEIWIDKRLLTDLLKERLREWPNGPNICVSPPPLTKSFRKRFLPWKVVDEKEVRRLR